MPLPVLFEDDHLLAIDKPSGLVVHPGAGTTEPTLVHALLHYCAGALPTGSGTERPGIVHRLDKETSGVLVVAKTDAAWKGLAEAFQERRTIKHYLAFARGVPSTVRGSIDAPIGRHPSRRTSMTVRDDGRSARTDWEAEAVFGELATRLRLRIHTGRTHQIRVHAKHIGHPLLGDPLYGGPTQLRDVTLPRVCLHAQSLQIDHPVTGAALQFEAPLPEDLQQVAAALRSAVP
jgi:23S rRNA pseudouridine1911/1915/1917 synthase